MDQKTSIQDLQEKLISAGLTEKSAAIYAFLVQKGGAYPSTIAEQTHLNRSTVYKILTDLSIKGLASEIRKKNKLFYQAENPKKFVKFTKNKITRAEDQLERAQKLLPELQGIFSLSSHQPVVRFFEGIDGVREVYTDHIDTIEPYEMCGISNADEVSSFLPEKFLHEYQQKKEKLKIKSRGIFPKTAGDEVYIEDFYKNVTPPKIRYIDPELFPYKGEITLYGKNKVSFVNIHGDQLAGIIIEDQTIHDIMQMTFELAWKSAGIK